MVRSHSGGRLAQAPHTPQPRFGGCLNPRGVQCFWAGDHVGARCRWIHVPGGTSPGGGRMQYAWAPVYRTVLCPYRLCPKRVETPEILSHPRRPLTRGGSQASTAAPLRHELGERHLPRQAPNAVNRVMTLEDRGDGRSTTSKRDAKKVGRPSKQAGPEHRPPSQEHSKCTRSLGAPPANLHLRTQWMCPSTHSARQAQWALRP